MTRASRQDVIHQLRQRVIRAIGTGALCSGDRLPSTRELARELHADPRLVAAAYRALASEGLVELRTRSGVYVKADAPAARRSAAPSLDVLVDTLTASALRGTPAPELVRALQRVIVDDPATAVVIATTSDQGLGIARELREEFGLDASAMLAERLNGDARPRALRAARLLVTTQAHARLVATLSKELGVPHIVISVRSDLFESEWSLWRGQRVHVVVLDPRFRRIVRQFLRSAGADDTVRVHLATDDLSAIGEDEPTYMTQAARTQLGRHRAPGMLIPPTRLLDESCIRELWRVIASGL